MTEDETRAELIDPKLKAVGWGVVEESKVYRNHAITNGKIEASGIRAKPLRADYVLSYKGVKLAVIEAKSDVLGVGEGVAQAKLYAKKLCLDTTYATNGKEIYSICMKSGHEGLVEDFLSPQALWDKTFAVQNVWREAFNAIAFENMGGTKPPRYYQENAVNKTLEVIANNQERILLTLATGTGKTTIAFHIAWKLFQTRWNLRKDASRRPRILFLADRNFLADQAYSEFIRYSAFKEDALVRIDPKEIAKKGSVPTNGNVFFTIFQTFMSGENEPYFGEYERDYFDFIIIDECHRGGANDEGNWRAILEYFSPAVQLGLTATPKRKDNVDTYAYFGEPVYVYSLKEGINDGFLTPFKVKRIKTTLDDYMYTSDDEVVEGEIEEGRLYEEADFNKNIEIKAREAKRVHIYMDDVNQNEKTIVFCRTQPHAAFIRDLINQYKTSINPDYCVRVTANDGALGEQYLKEFQNNEKLIPTVLTTSQKLSTGVDARNVRNIVLLRPVNSMIEFKQIVGRGTRLFEGKSFFTIYDFVDAYHHFADPEWDGEPIAPEPCSRCGKEPCECEKQPPKPCAKCGQQPCVCEKEPKKPCEKCGKCPCECSKKVIVKLADGKEREIQHMVATSFWGKDGKPISAEEFMHNLFGELPKFFTSEEELRELWSSPVTRKSLLEKLSAAGFDKEGLESLQKVINAEKSDIFDVLEYVLNADVKPLSREERVALSQSFIFSSLNDKQKEFIAFVLEKYIEAGVEELEQEKLPILLTNKYQSLEDAKEALGEVSSISRLFIEFQKFLYQKEVA